MRRSPNNRLRMLLLAGCAGLALAPAMASAQGQSRTAFNIPAQDLGTALTQFGQQSEREIVFSADLTRNLRARAVSGELTTTEALSVLLADSGLNYRTTSGGSIIVEAAADPQSGSAAGDGAEVEALIVTAQKREEDIQDVPIAISAFSQEDLTRSQIAGGPDLMTQIPNFTFTKTNFSSYSIQIRGIGTQAISATTDAAVAVAFNNTPFIRNRFFEQEFYDLQRVEVLRGPQGTLYGRNATAGVVNIISAKPSFNYEAKASADVANYSSKRLEGMINLPLVEDKVAMRLAGAWTKREGFVTNQITASQIDGRDLWSTRLSLRIEPTDTIRANFIWEHFHEDDDRLRSGKQLCKKDVPTKIGDVPLDNISGQYSAQQRWYSQGCVPASLYSDESFQTPNGFALPYYRALLQLGLLGFNDFDPYLSTTQSHDLRTIESTVDPVYKAKSDIGEVQLSVDVGDNLTLTSETAYGADFLFSSEDFNRFNTAPGAFDVATYQQEAPYYREGVFDNNGVFCDPQVGCSDRVVAVDLSTARSRQFSQEFRLSSAFDGPFNFSLGANFLRYDTEDKYYVFINTLTATVANTYTDFNHMKVFRMSPYVGGISDNRECLRQGMVLGDPAKVQNVVGCVYIDPNPIESVNDLGHNYFLSKNPYKLISYAAFGEIYYNITPDLKVTGGLRWTVDRKEAPEIPSWLLGANTVGYPVAGVIRQQWREPTGRLALDWKPELGFTDQTLLYASFAHGYKAGGANPPPTAIIALSGSEFTLQGRGARDRLAKSLTHPRTFEPEFVNAFEVGTKNTLLDGRLTFNANAFYYDYTGYQISELVDRAAINFNFDAQVWGVELETDWRPLENLRLGFKGGYEHTRVADGSKAIDLIDRTAGDPNWVVSKPFPTVPSNCIVPVFAASYGGQINYSFGGGSLVDTQPGFCILAYQNGLDPFTVLPYAPNPQVDRNGNPVAAGYPGFDPSTAPNNGEGIAKDLGGKELPNAPHFTATVTADYTIPLPHDWLLTLHSDVYRQSAAWARIFNDQPYDRIKPYVNVNFAAIFANEAAGWTIMAYVKNVLDKDNITGAFLNSDDTGLTTNVFLNEPRLYGLRVTKQWTGNPLWGGEDDGARRDPNSPYPLQVELGGMIERQGAHHQRLIPGFASSFPAALDTFDTQSRDLDWGDGREVTLTYQPQGSPWSASAGVRFGKTNGSDHAQKSVLVPAGCIGPHAFCDAYPVRVYNYGGPQSNYSDTSEINREEHTVVDFLVGRDFGLGSAPAIASRLSLGLRYAQLNSMTKLAIAGVPDWYLPPEWVSLENIIHHLDSVALDAKRSFKGAGPTLSWDASRRIIGNNDAGHVDIDWSLSGGLLFGKQKVGIEGEEMVKLYDQKYGPISPRPWTPKEITTTTLAAHRSRSVVAPTLGLSVGLSYEIQRLKLGAGYRWERYFDVIDGGIEERQTFDRTIDGPYFKLAIGFGG